MSDDLTQAIRAFFEEHEGEKDALDVSEIAYEEWRNYFGPPRVPGMAGYENELAAFLEQGINLGTAIELMREVLVAHPSACIKISAKGESLEVMYLEREP